MGGLSSRTSKKIGTHHMCYCIMTRGRIGIPTSPKTELPVIISNCFLSINIITKPTIPEAPETLTFSLVIPMPNCPTIILLESGQHSKKVFPGHLHALLIQVVRSSERYFNLYGAIWHVIWKYFSHFMQKFTFRPQYSVVRA